MLDNNTKEDLSLCYVISIVSKAGYNYSFDRRDDGIDMRIIEKKVRARGGSISIGNQLNLQLKSTTIAKDQDNFYKYKLKNKNYNDLSQFGKDYFILVVFIMNPDENLWIEQTKDELRLRKCAYWHYLGGKTLKTNEESNSTIEISKTKIFNEDALIKLFKIIDSGGDIDEC